MADEIVIPESFTKSFEEVRKLGTPVFDLDTEAEIFGRRRSLTKRPGADYCYGIGEGNKVRICKVDPGTGLCGYVDCVDVDPAKLKS